jgi:hypothetical protein
MQVKERNMALLHNINGSGAGRHRDKKKDYRRKPKHHKGWD